jgi:hypothetical protein
MMKGKLSDAIEDIISNITCHLWVIPEDFQKCSQWWQVRIYDEMGI